MDARVILTIARKDLRLLLRDSRSALILLALPLVMMALLGLTLGRMFGEKPDSKIRLSVLVEDVGLPADPSRVFPTKPWSDIVLDDLADTANIRVERIASREEAEALVRRGERAAVVVLGPEFSARAQRCSFVGGDFKKDPINPLFRDGVQTDELDVRFLTNPAQPVGASVMSQVVQVSLLRVIIPWMIGQAFDLIGTDRFMEKMEEKIPALGLAYRVPGFGKAKLGEGIRVGIGDFFSEYDFNAKTWAGLTESKRQLQVHAALAGVAGVQPARRWLLSLPPPTAPTRTDNRTLYVDPRGLQYQTLVPGTVTTFAYLLLLSVGWLFVAERRYGTLMRLQLAPISPMELLLGKALPCYLVSVVQGLFLLACGRWLFGMSWGPEPAWLLLLVATTSAAAVGLALVIATWARTETQVAVYGTLAVILLAGLSGSLLPREFLPESLRQISWFTPHAWSLDGYAQLLDADARTIDSGVVLRDAAVLLGFGLAGLTFARLTMPREP